MNLNVEPRKTEVVQGQNLLVCPQKQPNKQTKNYVYKTFMSKLSKEAMLNFASDSRILSSDAAAFTILPAQKLLTRTVFMTDEI